jgi:hypothetical protein
MEVEIIASGRALQAASEVLQPDEQRSGANTTTSAIFAVG